MLNVQSIPVDFPLARGPDQTIQRLITLPGTVLTAQVALSGFDISFGNGEHPLLRLRIDCNLVVAAGNVVLFNVSMAWRDNSGNFDDPYGGQVRVLVIADLA